MNPNRIQLTGKDILEKDFKTAMRGYNQVEVDEFLDIVIKDFETLNQDIKKLQQENERLKQTPSQPTRTRPPAPVQPSQQSNYDVLKRLSNLEKEVFGGKYVDS